MKKIFNKIRNIVAISLLAPIIGFSNEGSKKSDNELRIGYQKSDPVFIIIKQNGTLEKKLESLGIKVSWYEFPAGPQMLEGLNVGSIDFGTVGETPPIFAQAANAKIKYIGYKPASPKAEAIVVQENSSIKSVSDLKGKKVALNKGSNVHYLLVKALEDAGLKYSDIQPVFLAPSDARAAFQQGSVDAWVIWDPFLSAAETTIKAKVIKNGENIVNNYQFYLAEENYAAKNPKVIDEIFKELKNVDKWVVENPKEAAKVLSSVNGLDINALEIALQRAVFDTDYLNSKVIADQQKIADTFSDLKLIPKKLDIKSVVWIPEQKNK
ncbi:sulfonate ABC transporter substrate-binding protein [Aliarcobacter cibarius]|uniref:Putative aliphatic sulfonates-binding protein n=1 Tax=Aliarcobacter cibarius TaxID=255507 RepID=A0A7L5JM24_9BACT|nr:sulfonate ABC transporter substrate-binding protein [Aliarcobacter cibarius]QKJ26222.1 aliphatic sulfonate ABC transporter, periplasmic substrate-binding protein [Aliarcobacter cibarius]TLS97821.1 sulfonate ABC transporter substrate-binding protein [Aliarcobacter cibarius]TLS98632.1 sulfonate ABC transporter substrate-binding protein [Aliarcobacter cibarius]